MSYMYVVLYFIDSDCCMVFISGVVVPVGLSNKSNWEEDGWDGVFINVLIKYREKNTRTNDVHSCQK